jgi:5-methylthioribose kinase
MIFAVAVNAKASNERALNVRHRAAIFNSMLELGHENTTAYLHATGRLPAGVSAEVRWLAWGVSNVVLRVHPSDGDDFVIKQSREKLRTKADWFSRLDRIWREREVMETLAPLLPAGVVPLIFFEDRENYLFAMEAVDADHVVWKEELLNGRADPTIASRAGDYLARIHAGTANGAGVVKSWDREVFVQLRVDPFYRRIAAAHPDLRPAVERLIDDMWQTTVCAVHADFSPKNLLVTRHGLSLVDYETGHYGDPTFDIGFFLSHLLLKTVLHAARCEEYLSLVTAFWKHYRTGLGGFTAAGPFADPEFSERSVRHLAACMLARIDGTSTIDYLPAVPQQNLVRNFCRELLLDPPAELDEVLSRLRTQLKHNLSEAGTPV